VQAESPTQGLATVILNTGVITNRLNLNIDLFLYTMQDHEFKMVEYACKTLDERENNFASNSSLVQFHSLFLIVCLVCQFLRVNVKRVLFRSV